MLVKCQESVSVYINTIKFSQTAFICFSTKLTDFTYKIMSRKWFTYTWSGSPASFFSVCRFESSHFRSFLETKLMGKFAQLRGETRWEPALHVDYDIWVCCFWWLEPESKLQIQLTVIITSIQCAVWYHWHFKSIMLHVQCIHLIPSCIIKIHYWFIQAWIRICPPEEHVG